MGIYEILAFSYGNTRKVLVNGYDIVSAVMSSGLPQNEVISVKLVDSSDIEDFTSGQ